MEDKPDHAHTPHRSHQQSFDTAIYTPSEQQDLRKEEQDQVFEPAATVASPAIDDFTERFSLPPSRAESRDSFATPLSSNSRANTPDNVHQTLPDVDDDFPLRHQQAPDVQTSRQASVQDRQSIRSPSVDRTSVRDFSHPQPSEAHPQSRHTSIRNQSTGRTSNIRDSHHQDRSTPQDLPRGRLQTYVPKGFRASSTSLASTHHSMTLHKATSSGDIVDTDDTSPTQGTLTNRMLYSAGDRSSAESLFSQETTATSTNTLPPLQSKGPDYGDAHTLEPLLEDDPRSFDLVDPPTADEPDGVYALEKRAELMFSDKHLQAIFDDSKLLMKFTSFLNLHRPNSIPLLIYYLDALKAIRAIRYANAIAEALEPIPAQDFTKQPPTLTNNSTLERKANEAFHVLTNEDLPAYISYVWIQVVSISIQRRITGTLAPHLREASEGLAETFCLSDPSRKDNPIVFASEEFARTTQYGMTYAIGRNCRFLQGPRTNPNSVRRIAMACAAGKECNEVFVNYRRDGSPFLNLLMCAPLMDSKGEVRYYIGAQVDVSGLLKGCNELPGLAELVDKEQDTARSKQQEDHDEFQELTEMFNAAELDTVRKYGGRMHKEYVDDSDRESLADRRPRMVLKDTAQDLMDEDVDKHRDSSVPAAIKEKINGKLSGVYQHYLLVRPAPSLRILFTSPSLRVPGILQSPFLHRIGGSVRVRNDLATALGEGRGVTAKVRWLLKADEDGEGEGRPRWIHCTPLFGHSGSVGVWMILLVEEEGYNAEPTSRARRFRQAPPVSSVIGGKDWDRARSKTRENQRPTTSYTVDLQNARRGGSTGTDKGTTTPRPLTADHPQRAGKASLSDNDSVIGQAVSAPSPDVPRGARRGLSSHDDDYSVDVPMSRNSASYASGHVMSQMTGSRTAKGHSNASVFSLDLS